MLIFQFSLVDLFEITVLEINSRIYESAFDKFYFCISFIIFILRDSYSDNSLCERRLKTKRKVIISLLEACFAQEESDIINQT